MLRLEKITEMRKRIKINSDETASEQLENEAKELDESIKKELKSQRVKLSKKTKLNSGKVLKELAFKCF